MFFFDPTAITTIKCCVYAYMCYVHLFYQPKNQTIWTLFCWVFITVEIFTYFANFLCEFGFENLSSKKSWWKINKIKGPHFLKRKNSKMNIWFGNVLNYISWLNTCELKDIDYIQVLLFRAPMGKRFINI